MLHRKEKKESILKYNHREKSMKIQFTIYAEMGSLLRIINICYNDPEKSSATKINGHTLSGFSLFTYCSFNIAKNKYSCIGKDYIKFFSKDLRKHTTKVSNCEEKEMIALTNWN